MPRRTSLLATIAAAVLVVLPSLAVGGSSSTATAAAAAGEVQFTAAGDIGGSPQAQAVLQTVAASGSQLHLALGDLSYTAPGLESAWCDLVQSRVGAGFPFQLIAGNHESGGLDGNINDFSACLPNQLPGLVGTYGRQWYADVPQSAPLVRFIAISPDLPYPDGTWSYAAGTARYNWTAAAIDAARAAGIKWVVLGMHKPCLSVGRYGCGNNAELNNLLVAKRVDLVLSAHDHIYERSHQLRQAAGCASVVPGQFVPACVADNDGTFLRGAGTVFAGVGTGGTALYDASPGDPEAPYFATFSGAAQRGPHGVLSVTASATSLSARFLPTTTSSFSDSFVVRDAVAGENQPPTAVFSANCTGAACTFDASASSDVEGPVQGYSWNFGDGSPAVTGATAQHTFAASGSYTVTLTVRDGAGATGTWSRPITVSTGPTAGRLASDSFARTVSGGWGSADAGGPWSVTGGATAFSVNGAQGLVRVPAGGRPTALLKQVSTTSADVSGSVALDKVPAGGSAFVAVIGRMVPSAGSYRTRIAVAPNGSVSVALLRTSAAGGQTLLQPPVALPGVVYSASARLAVRMQVTGTSPTTIRAKVWPQGATEPSTWTRSTTDVTTGLQAPGSVGVATSLPATATNGPVTASLDDLIVQTP